MKTVYTLGALAVTLMATPLAAQPGALDPTFGSNGYVLDVALAEVNSLAVCPDEMCIRDRPCATR